MKVDCPSVLLIYTGGTIGMIENPETGALENFNFDQLLQHVPELKRFNYRISSYQFDPPIDSSDMEPSLWAKIGKRSRVRTKYTKNAKNIGIKKRASSHEPLAPIRKAFKAFLLNYINVT